MDRYPAVRPRSRLRGNAMPDFIFLMHDDAADLSGGDAWGPYIARLRTAGHFQGGSVIGPGVCVRKASPEPAITSHLSGFIRVVADSLDHARTLVIGNPVFEAGGTVEIRELPQTN
jgi:hypothetical protein